ncbi:hypothetical protein DPMN_150237 [Dreissena polymorpha]|uniref:Uncharacterized protein n=1 Tax=Dreissena polymorpha TaxID=45954 RepID=A0A9D4J5S8_DREPO|nr:hypothetical protein DPMN_150237 [Dreissena polymorpha]
MPFQLRVLGMRRHRNLSSPPHHGGVQSSMPDRRAVHNRTLFWLNIDVIDIV